MGRYREIIGGSWEHKNVFAESVPHLFHHDMAYLWTLEQQPDQRPKSWLVRIEAWKLLLRLFLLDQLAITPEELRRPLLDLTERFGVRRVTWLRHKQSSQAMGVLSPTVIVRPLPDFADEDLERWRSDLKDNDRDFRHLLHVAVKDLERTAAISPFATRIADVLKREFGPTAAAQRAPGGRAVEVPLLRRLTWEKRDGDEAPIGALNLSVRSDSANEIAPYIPRCAACGTLLLQEELAAPIDVDDSVLRIRCGNVQCEKPEQELPLEAFGIWLRNATTVVIWSPEQIPPMLDLMLPPAPDVSGNELLFDWNSTVIGGEPFRRFLRLRFPDRQIDVVPLMSIFFTRLLVPGEFASFSGSAVVPEWSDALDPARPAEVRPSVEQRQVEYRNVAVRGWPLRFSKFYKTLSLQYTPDLAVGLYPDPSLVGAGWKWYRAFVHGSESETYKVTCSDAQQILSSFASTERGLPRSVSVRANADQSVGVSYFPQRHERAEEYGGTVAASLAVDFGTTNTVVYRQPPARQQIRGGPRPKTHGLNPRDIATCALWLADNQSWRQADVIADFLPGPGYRRDATDPYVIPSEVWRIGREGFHLIRWSTTHPEGPSRQAVSQFKWDNEDVNEAGYTPTRLAFLRELVLQALPPVIAAFDPVRVTSVKIGFAFPLAFEHEAREQFRGMLTHLAAELTQLTGLEVDTGFSLNESKACVNAFGSFNGETFLVADMGGGTLDVALFSYDPDGTMNSHQMGSLRYAGERCVEALSVQLGIPEVTALRDSIARGESAKKYGKQASERVATQFVTIAFEFLRIMVAAYREQQGNAEEPIYVVLIGNGWHLIEAFSAQVSVRSGREVYREVYSDMVDALGDQHLVFYDRPPLSEFPSSKHLVVAGTLQNVTAQTSLDELSEGSITLARLPAGRSMALAGVDIPWSSLVGEGVKLPAGLDAATAADAKLFVRINEMPVVPPAPWMQRLANSMGSKKGSLPYPSDGELLRELRNGLAGTPPKLKRGPLQLILEIEWSQALTRRRGSVQ